MCDSAGVNGGFEIVKPNLPVNWIRYTPETIPSGGYDIIIDTTKYKEGRKSLQFQVRECSYIGGWHSPVICNEYEVIPGKKYEVGFWVQNYGSAFVMRFGGISAKDG
jgi:hypothetical protein